eukprot:1195717-Prorocentrum_minimum.AAC.5
MIVAVNVILVSAETELVSRNLEPNLLQCLPSGPHQKGCPGALKEKQACNLTAYTARKSAHLLPCSYVLEHLATTTLLPPRGSPCPARRRRAGPSWATGRLEEEHADAHDDAADGHPRAQSLPDPRCLPEEPPEPSAVQMESRTTVRKDSKSNNADMIRPPKALRLEQTARRLHATLGAWEDYLRGRCVSGDARAVNRNNKTPFSPKLYGKALKIALPKCNFCVVRNCSSRGREKGYRRNLQTNL